MDIAEIGRRIEVSPRRIRYVLDRGIVPFAERAAQGRGNARDFSDQESFWLALAAVMIDKGVRKPFTEGFLRGLRGASGPMPGSAKVLATAPAEDEVMMIDLAGRDHI